jgi:uncharacterized protein (TIGR03435 family)
LLVVASISVLIPCLPRCEAQTTQDLSGTWQGTLHSDPEMRIVLKIAKTPDAGNDVWQGVFYNIDSELAQHGRGTTVMALQGVDFKFAIPAIEGSYEGKLSANGVSISGTWTQGKESHALDFTRVTAETAWAIPDANKPMPANAEPKFEVATVKPTDPNWNSQGFHSEGRRIWCDNETVMTVISVAYHVHAKQIVGAPSWLGSDKYTINGVPDIDGEPSLKQMQGMYRKLLADRFNLKLHVEKRDLSFYAITVARGGPKLAKSLGDPKGLPDQTGNWGGVNNGIRFTNSAMDDLVLTLNYILDKPVVDKTELAGKFDFFLRWTSAEAEVSDPGAPPGLFTAMQEQLGLKLEPVKAPADVLVIDHVERPSAN